MFVPLENSSGLKEPAPGEKIPFWEAEAYIEATRPQILRTMETAESASLRREHTYHFIAAKLTEEGSIDKPDPEVKSVTPVVTRTLREWHGLWAEAAASRLARMEELQNLGKR